MNIDVTKIENYEAMTPEQKVAALEAYTFEEPTSDDKEKIKLKEALNKTSSQYAELKREFAKRQTEEERKETERLEAEKAKDELIANLTREKDIATLTKGFEKAGKHASDMATAFLDKDADKFASTFEKFLADHDKDINAAIIKETPKPDNGNATKTVTKEQFNNMGYAELAKLKSESPELYAELNS